MKKIIAIVLAVIILVGATFVFINKTPKKDGEDIIFKTDYSETNVSEYYTLLKEYYEDDYIYQRFEKDLLTSMDKTPETISAAKDQVQQLNEQLAQTEDPEANKQNVILTLQSLGYTGFDQINLYFENYITRQAYIETYLYENIDTYFDAYQQTSKPRYASHILFTVADLKNVTEAETNTMNNIRERIVGGEDFATLAKEFSQDGSKEDGGKLGLMDANTNFVEPFLKAALALENGELSQWVQSEFGFHLITVDTSNKETITKDAYTIPNMLASVPQIDLDAMKALIDKSDITFVDEDIKASILAHFTVKGQD